MTLLARDLIKLIRNSLCLTDASVNLSTAAIQRYGTASAMEFLLLGIALIAENNDRYEDRISQLNAALDGLIVDYSNVKKNYDELKATASKSGK